MADLMREVARFKEWANAFPEERRYGECECEYEYWGDLYSAVLRFVDARSFGSWSAEELRAVLFAIARDNEMEHLVEEIRTRNSETLVALALAAVTCDERDAKWQLANQLG